MSQKITDHKFRPQIAGRLTNRDKCGFMNCGKSPSQHETSVKMHPERARKNK